MKKLILIVVVALLAVCIAACQGGADGDVQGNVTFTGTIVELNGDDAIVEPLEEEEIRSSADKISIYLGDTDETFSVGDKIIVEYDGSVMESYPAQVNVLGIEKVVE